MAKHSTPAIRPWCALVRYPGLLPFTLGTVIVDAKATSEEAMKALHDHALTFIPPGFEIIRPLAGSLFFQPDDEGE